ncbi:MAG TPA: hypothetical protein VIP98_17205 [Microlunatus sp.]
MQHTEDIKTRHHRPTPVDSTAVQTRTAFRTTKIILAGYLGIGLALLLINLVLALSGHGSSVSSFMWGRSCGVTASGAVFGWFADAASRGHRWAYRRIQIISIILPVIIVALALLPGVAPLWFRLAQFACAGCIGAGAFVINRKSLRRLYAQGR